VGIHELDFLTDIVILWSNWSASGSALCVFSGENDQAESGRGWEGADIGDGRAGLQEFDVGGGVNMGVNVHDGGFGGRHFLPLLAQVFELKRR
jgi:hypothetical protein